MNSENKSAILSLIVKIINQIRVESASLEDRKNKIQLLKSYIKNISIDSNGSVYAIFNNVDLQSSQNDDLLNNTPCGCLKTVGNIYYLYQKEDNYKFLSLLSPKDWGDMIPGSLEGAFKLEANMTWSRVEINE